MGEKGLTLRQQYPNIAPLYAAKNLAQIEETCAAFTTSVVEQAGDLDVARLVRLANSDNVSMSKYAGSIKGCAGGLYVMGQLFELNSDLRPYESADVIRDLAAAQVEDAAQLGVSSQIGSKVYAEIAQTNGQVTDTILKLQKYAPKSSPAVIKTAKDLYLNFIANFQDGAADEVLAASALAFGHVGGSQTILVPTKKGLAKTSLDRHKLDLLLGDRTDYQTYLRQNKGKDDGAKKLLEGIDVLAALAFDIEFGYSPSALGLAVALATARTKEVPKTITKATVEAARKTAANRNKAVAVAALAVTATSVGLQPAAAAQHRGKPERSIDSRTKHSNPFQNFNSILGVVTLVGTVNVSLDTKSKGRHTKEASAHSDSSNKEQYKGHELTPEIRSSLQEIIARDNPWKNRGIATLFFMENGFTLEQATAHVGNFMVESKVPGSDKDVNPNAHQIGNDVGQGIAQWTKSDRWENLVKFAIRHDMDPRDLTTQLEFIMYEYDGPENAAYHDIKNSFSVEDATRSFLRMYERAGNPHGTQRVKNAEQVFDEVLDGAKRIVKRNAQHSDSSESVKPPVVETPPVVPPADKPPVIPVPTVEPSAQTVPPVIEVPVIPAPRVELSSETAPPVIEVPVMPTLSMDQFVIPMEIAFTAPPAAEAPAPEVIVDAGTAIGSLIMPATVASNISDAVIAFNVAPVYTAPPESVPPSDNATPNPTISVPAESIPTAPQLPSSAAPVIEGPAPSISLPTTEQPPMTSGNIPPAVEMPKMPDFTWAPPVVNTPPPSERTPGVITPETSVVVPIPDPIINLPPEVAPDPTPPIVVPAPPEVTPPVQNEHPVIIVPTPPEVTPPQIEAPQHEDPPKEEQKPKEETPKQDDPPKDDKKPDEKPKDDNKNDNGNNEDDKSDGPDIKIEGSNTDCAPGTISLGSKKTNDGRAEMCAVIGLLSSSRESTPGDSMYIKGSNGLAIVNASFSDNISKLVQRAEKDGKHLNALSSYRSYKHQKQLCDDDTACSNGDHTFIAAPGHSEHGDGGAVDLDILHGDKDNCVWDNGICTAPHDKDWMYLKPIIKDYGINQYSKEAWHLDTKVH